MPTIPKHCAKCGKFFTVTAKKTTTRIKYCSPKCSKEAQRYRSRGSYQKECKICGKGFKTIYPKQQYCSHECQKTVGHDQYVEKKGTEKKDCLYCGQTFETTSLVKKYCSKQCYKIAKNRRDKDFMFNKKLQQGDM